MRVGLPDRRRKRRLRGGRWNIFLGLMLMSIAFWFAANPEYPVSTEMSPTSTDPEVVLLPESICPRGNVALEGLVFEWLWEGQERSWTLVLLDAALEELAVVEGIQGTSLVPEGELRAALVGGGRFHWFVSYDLEGETYRSLPTPFELPRR